MGWQPQDLSAQIDGIVSLFTTTFARDPGRLVVFHNGVLQAAAIFTEPTSNTIQLTLVPAGGDTLWAIYHTDETADGRISGVPYDPTGVGVTFPQTLQDILDDLDGRTTALEGVGTSTLAQVLAAGNTAPLAIVFDPAVGSITHIVGPTGHSFKLTGDAILLESTAGGAARLKGSNGLAGVSGFNAGSAQLFGGDAIDAARVPGVAEVIGGDAAGGSAFDGARVLIRAGGGGAFGTGDGGDVDLEAGSTGGGAAGQIKMSTDSVVRWLCTTLGHLAPNVDGAVDVGTALKRPGKVYAKTSFVLPSYTVVEVGSLSATPAGQQIFVTDETGGAVPAFSDGSAWRRCTDRNVIS